MGPNIPGSFPYKQINLDTQKFELKVKLLGLRKLESSGLLPVTKPYIKFNLKGL